MARKTHRHHQPSRRSNGTTPPANHTSFENGEGEGGVVNDDVRAKPDGQLSGAGYDGVRTTIKRFRTLSGYCALVAAITAIAAYSVLSPSFAHDKRMVYPWVDFATFVVPDHRGRFEQISQSLSFGTQGVLFSFNRIGHPQGGPPVHLVVVVEGLRCKINDKDIPVAEATPSDSYRFTSPSTWPLPIRYDFTMPEKSGGFSFPCSLTASSKPWIDGDVTRREQFAMVPLQGKPMVWFDALHLPADRKEIQEARVNADDTVASASWDGGIPDLNHGVALRDVRIFNLEEPGLSNVARLDYEPRGESSRHDVRLIVAAVMLGITGQAVYELGKALFVRRLAE